SMLERRGAPRRRDAAARREQILRAVRDAVQRPAVAPGAELLFRTTRLLQRAIARERDDGVELPADGVQALERVFRERNGRHAAGADVGAELTDRAKREAHGSAR